MVPAKYLDANTIYHLQPSGRFVIGGPQVTPRDPDRPTECHRRVPSVDSFCLLQGDAGVTGRKIIVDTYGGWGAHGGGAFSGKDFSKVDRSAAYAARWVAKSLVKAKLCRRVLVQVSVKKWLTSCVVFYGFLTFFFFFLSFRCKICTFVFLILATCACPPGLLRHRRGSPSVHLVVHVRLVQQKRIGAAAHRQQKL